MTGLEALTVFVSETVNRMSSDCRSAEAAMLQARWRLRRATEALGLWTDYAEGVLREAALAGDRAEHVRCQPWLDEEPFSSPELPESW